jgi:hypothetical protein
MQPWRQLSLLNQRYLGNLTALSTRYPALAESLKSLPVTTNHYFRIDKDRIILGVGEQDTIRALPAILTPASARATLQSMFPDNHAEVALVAGEDLGWLWNMLYQMEISTAPEHCPLFFLIRDLQRLQVMLHIQDWRILLADPRVQLFAGDDCVQQFRQSLIDQPLSPRPRLAVTILPDTWPSGVTFESIFVESAARACERTQVTQQSQPLPVPARSLPDRVSIAA